MSFIVCSEKCQDLFSNKNNNGKMSIFFLILKGNVLIYIHVHNCINLGIHVMP